MDDGSARIELRRRNAPSMWAVVDEADYERVAGERWQAHVKPNTIYVKGSLKIGGRWVHVRLHRFILNAQPGALVDHIDHDGLNNRRSNLRFADDSQNGGNKRATRGGHSQYKGVTWEASRSLWVARIEIGGKGGVRGKSKNLGRFAREADAALAYDQAARDAFGEFACLNFPDGAVA